MTEATCQLLDAALGYAARGLPVFPCRPRAKKPATTHGFKDATTDANAIQAWWRDMPDAGIGMPTGAVSGLFVIDVDPRHGGPESLDQLTEQYGDLPATAESHTGDGGRHLFFRHPGEHVRCSQSEIGPGIDIKGDGGYVVLPPTIHPNGTAYTWELSSDIADVPPADCPAWLKALVCAQPPTVESTTTEADGNPIPSGQRNATLARLAGAMRRVGMGRAEIVAALHVCNTSRCRPPLPPAEVDRIGASVARYAPDMIATAVVENHYEQDRQVTVPTIAALDDPGPFPDRLLNVPGFVGELAEYSLRTAPYPQPVLAFAGALSCQAFLAGRRVRDASDSRTNLYVLALANSGAGKDHPRKVNQRVLLAAGLHECLGDKFASGEGIEDRLFIQPSMLFQTDEIDGLMQAINRAGDARHEGILNVLLKMYTSGNALYPMRVKAGKESPGVIDQPSLCMLGTAVPRYYYEALSMRMLNNGFFARLLILEATKRGSGQDPCGDDLPQNVIDTAKWWAQYTPGGGGDLSQWHPRPTLVPETPAATAVFRDLRAEADERYQAAEERDDPTAMAIWARAYEKARKLSLIYAVSESHTNPQISEPAARWAWEMVSYQTRRMLFMAAQHVAEGEFDAKCKRMVEVLTQWQQRRGDAWMPHWDLSRRLKWSDREIDEVRDALLGQERICFEVGSTAKGGRSGQKYRLTPAAPSG